jgi:cyclopropane-fatty-acyl-phospholipid synthase
VLEIGFGWGGLAERLLSRYDCSLTGLTLSIEQLVYAQARMHERGFARKCDFRLQDYRDADGTYDRIVSVEMLEAVGEAYWPVFFSKLKEKLRPQGVAVLQVITIKNDYFAFYRRHPDYIQKYVFPGGMLPTPEIIGRETAQAGLRLDHSELFGDSYAKTIAEWSRRFQKAWPTIEALGFDLRFKRMWEYYLGYCQAGFETGIVNVGLYKISS